MTTIGENSNLKLNKIKVGNRFRKDLGDLKQLKNSIQEIGLLHPLVVSEKNELIAGYRRLKALQELGYEESSVTVVNLEDLRKGEIQENLVRKNFTVSEMVAIKRAMEPEVSVGQGKRTDLTCGNFPQVKGEKTRDILGSYVGVSGRTLEKAEKIVEAAEQHPEKFGKLLEKVDNKEISVHAAHIQVRRAEKHINPPELPDGEFDEYTLTHRGIMISVLRATRKNHIISPFCLKATRTV